MLCHEEIINHETEKSKMDEWERSSSTFVEGILKYLK